MIMRPSDLINYEREDNEVKWKCSTCSLAIMTHKTALRSIESNTKIYGRLNPN